MGNKMGKKIQRIFLIIFAALLCCFSAGCSHKNTVAECRSGINEECKKYYKPVEVIKQDN